MAQFIKRLRSFTWKVVVIIQRILITVLLFFVYFVGLGIMFALAWLFRRSILSRGRASSSTWRAVQHEYDVTIDTAQRES